jgi:hypothetical protein
MTCSDRAVIYIMPDAFLLCEHLKLEERFCTGRSVGRGPT